MAQFKGEIRGERGHASRLGSKESGLKASVEGWGMGVSVEAEWNEQEARDVFAITLTGKHPHFLGYYHREKDGTFKRRIMGEERPL